MSREVLAGVIEASCTCCPEARALIHHIQLGPTRMLCPETGRTFLDRGDGVFQADGHVQAIEARAAPAPSGGATTTDLLSDRPARTPEKTRITLERATFAGTCSLGRAARNAEHVARTDAAGSCASRVTRMEHEA